MDLKELTPEQYEALVRDNPTKRVTLSPSVLIEGRSGLWKHVMVNGSKTHMIVSTWQS